LKLAQNLLTIWKPRLMKILSFWPTLILWRLLCLVQAWVWANHLLRQEKILDKGGILAIATDWNPGSAPMGNLVTQASILATYQKLTTAEVLAAITFRAAYALDLEDRGVLSEGKKADFITYETDNFQNILYHQGSLKPKNIYINGEKI
jgi:imidazolonepropionase-like amidohydrolase